MGADNAATAARPRRRLDVDAPLRPHTTLQLLPDPMSAPTTFFQAPHLPAGARVVAAMSGGVDSSVAAWLLREAGFETVGLFMRNGVKVDAAEVHKKSCCSLSDARMRAWWRPSWSCPSRPSTSPTSSARSSTTSWRSTGGVGRPTLRPLQPRPQDGAPPRAGRRAGRRGRRHGALRATRGGGRPRPPAEGPRRPQGPVVPALQRARAPPARTLLPLGDLEKPRVGAAAAAGLRTSHKADSQEVCFVPSNDYRNLLAERGVELHPGSIVDTQGRVLGQHEGTEHYTIGQRRGLRVATGRPLFVVELLPDEGLVVVGDREECKATGMRVDDLNWIGFDAPDRFECLVQHRYHCTPSRVEVRLEGDGATVRFEEPGLAVTPGQGAAFTTGIDSLAGAGSPRPSGRARRPRPLGPERSARALVLGAATLLGWGALLAWGGGLRSEPDRPALRVVLLDASASVTRGRVDGRRALREELLRQLRTAEEAGEDLAVVRVQRGASVACSPAPAAEAAQRLLRPDAGDDLLGRALDDGATDLAGALELAAELLAEGGERAPGTVVVVGDGLGPRAIRVARPRRSRRPGTRPCGPSRCRRATRRGGVLPAHPAAGARGRGRSRGGHARGPRRGGGVHPGGRARVRRSAPGRGGAPRSAAHGGASELLLQLPPPGARFTVRARVRAGGDALHENDQRAADGVVAGRPVIVVVDPAGTPTLLLRRDLERAGAQVVSCGLEELRDELRGAAALVTVEVPLGSLPGDGLRRLVEGGGLWLHAGQGGAWAGLVDGPELPPAADLLPRSSRRPRRAARATSSSPWTDRAR